MWASKAFWADGPGIPERSRSQDSGSGWSISQQDGSTGTDLLPRVSATFEWIRLAQRIPVRIRLVEVPEEIKLRIGTTCSVLVRKESAAGQKDGSHVSQTQ